MNSLKNLNLQQQKAVLYDNGPLLIIAGAGTGKTTVITQKITHLILEKNVLPSNILALTFTDKAAHEMEERVDIALPYGYTNLWIHTFHSFCDRILRDDAYTIGLDPNYKMLTESESILFMRQHIFDLGLKIFKPLGNPTKFLDGLLTHFSRLKDEDIEPDAYLAWAESRSKNQELGKGVTRVGGPHRVPAGSLRPKPSDEGDERQDPNTDEIEQYLELARAYKAYEDLKAKESVMDFADLISNTLLLFRKRPNILKRYQDRFTHILVDEFQDTNYAQNELAILLAGRRRQNITVVADDDQSIYRFRGAAVSNVLQFKKNFPKATIITLTQNYRSAQTILDSSYALIQHNNPNRLEVTEHIDKKLQSQNKSKGKEITFIHTVKAEDEADEIAKEITKLTKDTHAYNDIAILVRANNHSQAITAALSRHRIPYQFLGPGYLFQQEEIKDLIAYLTFLTNLSDSVSLFRVLSMDVLGISYIELNYYLNFAKKNNLTLFEALQDTSHKFLKPATKEKLEKFLEMVKRHVVRIKKEQAGQILYYFLVDSGLYEKLQHTNSVEGEKQVGNIAKFFDRMKAFESDRPDATIFTFVEWLSLMMQMGDSPIAAEVDSKERNAVSILTVHSSKGLEFKVVFLVNLVTERFPTRERREKIPLPEKLIKENVDEKTDFHLEEERRLFYVGMTRAKELLYFTAADYYGTGKRAKKISPFVYEASPLLKDQEVITMQTKQILLVDALSSYQEPVHTSTKEELSPYKVDYITFSNLQMFDICPLHYKAKVLFKIPTPKVGVQSFGISLHNTLYAFYRDVQEGKKVNLLDLKKVLQRSWDSEGYLSKKDEEERFTQANKILEEFFKTECNPPVKPLGLELPFSFTLKNNVKVFGKIDRVDSKENGIEIIDYKTGADNPKAAQTHELQLAIYALAATRVKDDIFNRKPEDITLTLHFLEGNTKKSMNFTKEDLEKLENELITKIEEIEKSDFACSGNILCQNCEFRMLCKTI